MNSAARFTDGRVPDSTVRLFFTDDHRWQRWLDVEAALAVAEAECGIIPHAAAKAIVAAADIKQLDIERIHAGRRKTSHKLMPLITELSDAVGEPHNGWIHWGATSENIHKTGDLLVLRDVHHIFLALLGKTFTALESLASEGKAMICAGRTHGQHAVPITFGFKVAGWIDELSRHVERFKEVEPRVFTVMMGGAVGNYASLREKGPAVQDKMGKILQLQPMPVPSRAMSDAQAEYICILGLLAGTMNKIAREVALLMETEFGEVCEPIPEGTISSSTMPHKRNPQLADDCMAFATEIRSLVPLALEGMLHEHEVNGANTTMTDDAIERACILTGDLLTRINVILEGLTLNEERMRANLDLTGGLIMSEAIMLKLGESIGRQKAHEIVYEAAQTAATSDKTFKELLCADPRVTDHMDEKTLSALLNPRKHIGLSIQLAKESAERAHKLAARLNKTKQETVLPLVGITLPS
jgi:3-carboxy-cis,cis-muconate cycloisomerase